MTTVKLTASERETLRTVAAADDGYKASPTDRRMLSLWERDLLHFYAPECLWFISDAGRAALAQGDQ